MSYDIFGFGNALVDVIVEVDDETLSRLCTDLDMTPANSNLLDSPRMARLLEAIEPIDKKVAPGGSVTNVVTGAANLGARTAFSGMIAADKSGALYVEDLERNNITPFVYTKAGQTGTAVTLMAPDAERTFGVDMGVAPRYVPDQLPLAALKNSQFFHVSVYELVDPLKDVTLEAMEFANAHDVDVSLDLASVVFINQMREELVDIIRSHVDIVFANEEEAEAFVGDTGMPAVHAIGEMCRVACMKLGAKGAVVKHGILHRVEAYPAEVVDLNGAGDAFAAGFLTARSQGLGYEQATRVGCYYGARTVEVQSARLNRQLDLSRLPL